MREVMMVDVTISLVSHNQRKDLEILLASLIPAARLGDAEILLVDNCSEDGALEYVRSHYPEVQVFTSSRRRGYGENHNLNLQRALGRYFVIMNSDMSVGHDVFIVLKEYLDAHGDVGIVSPKVLNPDGTIQGLNKRYPSVLDISLRGLIPQPLRHYFRRRLDYYEMRDVGYDVSCEVPFLSGAFMFCRTDQLRSIGGFDPAYFLYFEDVDLCRRMQETHRTVYIPDVSVTHYWKRAAHTRWIFTYYFLRSAIRYFCRWGFQLC